MKKCRARPKAAQASGPLRLGATLARTLFVELVDGLERVEDGHLVVGRVEVEQVDALLLQRLQGVIELRLDLLWRESHLKVDEGKGGRGDG